MKLTKLEKIVLSDLLTYPVEFMRWLEKKIKKMDNEETKLLAIEINTYNKERAKDNLPKVSTLDYLFSEWELEQEGER